jgi:hypothetical protein
MKDKSLIKYVLDVIALSSVLLFAGCSKATEGVKEPALRSNSGSPVSSASPTPLGTPSPGNNDSTSGNAFSATNVCSLPQNVAADSQFAALGGGTWAKWDDAGGELSYGCSNSTDSIKLEDVTAKIKAYYAVLGDAEKAHNISAKYVALQYGGKIPTEGQIRQQYVKFCDSLSTKLFGAGLPEESKKRLADESVSSSEAAREHQGKVGNGYVNITSRITKAGMMEMEVEFFPSEDEYKKYSTTH